MVIFHIINYVSLPEGISVNLASSPAGFWVEWIRMSQLLVEFLPEPLRSHTTKLPEIGPTTPSGFWTLN